MTKHLITIAMVGLVGCGEPAWAIGSYFSPAYHADGKDQPAQGVNIRDDGTWSRSKDGDVDLEGAWTAPEPGVLVLDDDNVSVEPNCRIFSFQGRSYYRDDTVPACTIAPLTPLEYCLVGEYMEVESTSAGTVVREIEIDEDRFYRFRFDRETGSDYVEFTNIKYWRVEGTRLIQTIGEYDESIPLDADAWAYFDGIRIGARHPECNVGLLPR